MPPLTTAAGSDSYSFAEKVDPAGAAWVMVTEEVHTDLIIRVFDHDERSTWTGPVHYTHPGIELFYAQRERDPATELVTEVNYEGFSGGANGSFDFHHSPSGAGAGFSLDLYGCRCVYGPDDPGGKPQGKPTVRNWNLSPSPAS
jgi:hypothetical protein